MINNIALQPNVQNSVVLSQNKMSNINFSKKRASHPEAWKDEVAKRKRNSGQDYQSRNGIQKAAVVPPTVAKVCGNHCHFEGCTTLTLPLKITLFNAYYGMASYNMQHTYLLTMIDGGRQNGRNVFGYHVKPEGQRFEVCRITFMDTFKIRKKSVEVLQNRLTSGTLAVIDNRGKHGHQRRNPQDLINAMNAHILRFPQYECHYSRRQHEVYLSPDLSVSKMFRLFIDEFPAIQNGNPVLANIQPQDLPHKENFYRKAFQDSKLRIGEPSMDTCETCDRLQIRLKCAQSNQERQEILEEKDSHLLLADAGYSALNEDIRQSKVDVSYVVKVGDLQKVLFTPTLSHSEMFYRRQLSSYNFCLYDGRVDNAKMCFWSEIEGNRGVDEIGSCILECIKQDFLPLQQNQKRTLVFWSDRCAGQVNNYHILTLFKYLIQQRYFTRAEHKVLITGHTFLPCDRMFALIEKKKDAASCMVPDEWISIIRETRIQHPFEIVRMDQTNIMNIMALEQHIPRPRDLLVTQHHWYYMDEDDPHLIFARDHYLPGPWLFKDFTIRRPNQRQRIVNRQVWTQNELIGFNLAPKYTAPIPIAGAKYRDLISMVLYMMPQYRPFYQNLPHNV